MKNQKGITLIALVITIIVLLILAGVAIAMLSGDNGILTKASESSEATAITGAKEKVIMAVSEATTEYYKKAYVDNENTTLFAHVDAALTKLKGNKETGAEIKYETAEGETNPTVTIEYVGNTTVTITGTVYAADEMTEGENPTVVHSAGSLVWNTNNKY